MVICGRFAEYISAYSIIVSGRADDTFCGVLRSLKAEFFRRFPSLSFGHEDSLGIFRRPPGSFLIP